MPRAKAYDETALLDRAMEAFWARGFDRTSIEDLVGRTGVNRASLYAAYPDKRALFIAGLRRYLDLIVEGNVRRLTEVEPASEAVRRFFLQLVEAPIDRLRRGCLLTSSAIELGESDPEVASLIRGAFRRVEDAIFRRLVQAQRADQLAEDADPRTLARLLVTVLQGIRVMARVGVDREAMRQAVSGALSGIKSEAARVQSHTRRSMRNGKRSMGRATRSGRTSRSNGER